MFHGRGLNNKLNGIHEKALRITYNDKSSLYRELLAKDSSLTKHYRNIRALATEMYKNIQGISLKLLNDIFNLCNVNSYNFCGNTFSERRKVKLVRHDAEFIWFLASQILEILPIETKDLDALQIFKEKIKKWVPAGCPCRLCKIYLPQDRFI